jgi:hypothetical protein
VPAAVEAEVFPGDADPLEVLRRLEHLPHQVAVVLLDPLPLFQGQPRLGHPAGEAVANRLQLAEVEHPGRGRHGVDPVGDLGMAERLREEVGKLRLEAGDLPAQLQPRVALVDPEREPGELLSFQQSGHRLKV